MSEEQFKVVFSGTLRPGTDVEHCIAGFAKRFHVSTEMARGLIQDGREVVLKKRLDADTAASFQAALEKLGMEVRVEPMQAEATDLAPGSTSATDSGQDPAGHDNPYAAPAADLFDEPKTADGEMNGPHARPIGNGWLWLKQGFAHFKQNPMPWIGTVIVWGLLVVALDLIPFVGKLTSILISPVLMAGIMLGCREQERGSDFQVSHLFAGFSHNTGQLLLLGVFALVGSLLFTLIMVMIGGSAFFAMQMGAAHSLPADPQQMFQGVSPWFILLGVLAILTLAVLMSIAFFYAPALVALEDMPAWPAVQQSFSAVGKNILPFLWYGIIAFVFLILGAIPLLLGLLVVWPMLLAAIYTSYRDIYYA